MSNFRSIKPAPKGRNHTQTHPQYPVISPTVSVFDFIDTLTPRERSLVSNPPYNLKISLEDLLCSTRQQQYNSRTKEKPPRAPKAWILFRKSFANEYRTQNPDKPCTMQKISKLARDKWTIQSDNVKEYFATLAKLALQQHRATYPNYVYKPKKPIKRNKKNQTWLFREVNRDAFVKNKNGKTKTDSKNEEAVNESCSCDNNIINDNNNDSIDNNNNNNSNDSNDSNDNNDSNDSNDNNDSNDIINNNSNYYYYSYNNNDDNSSSSNSNNSNSNDGNVGEQNLQYENKEIVADNENYDDNQNFNNDIAGYSYADNNIPIVIDNLPLNTHQNTDINLYNNNNIWIEFYSIDNNLYACSSDGITQIIWSFYPQAHNIFESF